LYKREDNNLDTQREIWEGRGHVDFQFLDNIVDLVLALKSIGLEGVHIETADAVARDAQEEFIHW